MDPRISNTGVYAHSPTMKKSHTRKLKIKDEIPKANRASTAKKR
jgi:hypothetical protein